MEPMSLPPGYLLPEGKTMQDILRMDAELLAGEGIDPAWPGFEGPPEDSEADSVSTTGCRAGGIGLDLSRACRSLPRSAGWRARCGRCGSWTAWRR